jgi:tRNA A-37 threonylcarbamoyl transferase component Bud32
VSNGATPPLSVAAFAVGSSVAGYRLEEQIGRGGMAVVFRALDERLNRRVALKILRSAQQDDAFRQRFVRESQAAAAVDDPHIIPVYEAGEADGVLFIAMRLVQGGDLRTLVTRNGPLSPARTGWIVSCVAAALDAAHARGLVHRDVKPANMLLDVHPGRPDHVYLSDFGVSKAALETGGATDSGQFLGTVDYAAPEQIHGAGVDGRTDQYALGCSAYELLCGRPPFSGKELLAVVYAHVSQPPPPPSSIRDGLPAAVDAVFARVLAKSPAERYGTCDEFASELRSALGLRPYAERPAAGSEAGDDATLDPAAARVQAARIRAVAGGAWPDSGSTIQLPASVPSAQPGPAARPAWPAGGSRRHLGAADGVRWRRLLAGALAAVLVGGGVAAFALTHGRTPAPAVPIRFSQAYGDGLAVTQVWRLSGWRGSRLDVTIKASTASNRPVNVQLKEPIPATVAGSLDQVTFPLAGPRHLLPAGSRVVAWELPLLAGGSAEVAYQVKEPAKGATAARLSAFVRDFNEVAGLQGLEVVRAGQLKYMVIVPSEVWLQPGGKDQLTLRGTRSSSSARLQDLHGARWSSANPAFVTVSSSGVVVGVAPGTALVTARIGSVSASALVIVYSVGSSPPYSAPPAQSSPATSPPPGSSSPPGGSSSPPSGSSSPPGGSSSPPSGSSSPPGGSSSPPSGSSSPPASTPPAAASQAASR